MSKIVETVNNVNRVNSVKGVERVGRLGVGLAVMLGMVCCFGDELGEKGRAIFAKNRLCVVTVELVLKSKFMGRSNEARQDATGTVVDPSGLTVLSLSATDPSQLYENFMGDSEEKMKMEKKK